MNANKKISTMRGNLNTLKKASVLHSDISQEIEELRKRLTSLVSEEDFSSMENEIAELGHKIIVRKKLLALFWARRKTESFERLEPYQRGDFVWYFDMPCVVTGMGTGKIEARLQLERPDGYSFYCMHMNLKRRDINDPEENLLSEEVSKKLREAAKKVETFFESKAVLQQLILALVQSDETIRKKAEGLAERFNTQFGDSKEAFLQEACSLAADYLWNKKNTLKKNFLGVAPSESGFCVIVRRYCNEALEDASGHIFRHKAKDKQDE